MGLRGVIKPAGISSKQEGPPLEQFIREQGDGEIEHMPYHEPRLGMA